MRDLTYDEFELLFSSYWGRRELGIVLDDMLAQRYSDQSLSTFHEHWLTARRLHPERSSIWLLGTPDFSPDIFTPVILDPSRVPPVNAPPIPRVGRYAGGVPGPTGPAVLAGDFSSSGHPKSRVSRSWRKLRRGHTGVTASFAALLLFGFPYIAIPLAILGLVWCVRASREHARIGFPLRIRRAVYVGQLAAAAAIVLSTTVAVTAAVQ